MLTDMICIYKCHPLIFGGCYNHLLSGHGNILLTLGSFELTPVLSVVSLYQVKIILLSGLCPLSVVRLSGFLKNLDISKWKRLFNYYNFSRWDIQYYHICLVSRTIIV